MLLLLRKFILLWFIIGTLSAQTIDPLLYSAMKYRSIGPYRGGRSTAVCGIPDQPHTFFMGTTGGGVWKTDDGGNTWDNVSDGYFKTASIGAVEVSVSDPNTIYVGTGSACPRGNISQGDGVYKSNDGGRSWQHVGLRKAGLIGKILIHPGNPDIAWVAVLGNIFGKNTERGVYKTVDGGAKWEKVCYLSDSVGAVDLAMDPKNPRILYAGFWRVERKPWTLIDGAKEGGVYKSIDGGTSWRKLEGLPNVVAGRIGIAVSPANPNRIWVLREAQEEDKGGLFRSDDAGKTWTKINREHKLRLRAWYYSHICADPRDENTVYVMTTSFHKSVDGGANFSSIPTPHGDNHGLWINPNNTDIMIECNDGGANVTYNGGRTWSTQFNQPTAELYRVTVDNQFPYRVYGAQQDNTTISVPGNSIGGISPLQYWMEVGGGESGHIAVDPRDPAIVYAGNYIGQIDRTDLKSGHTRNVVAYPQMHDGTAGRDIRYRFQWNAPIRISPHNPDIIYHASQYVHRSLDKGQTWERISPDLTTNDDALQDIPGGPVQHDHTGVELYTTIFALEESPLVPGHLWVGSDDGRVHLSKDAGKSWADITPDDLPKRATINMIDLSTQDPARAFIAVHKYRENDMRPYIYKTDDYGKSWKLLTTGNNGIPVGHFVRVVREDPNRKGLLYAGTEYGMYVSFNEGFSWQTLQLNLPLTPINDMVVHQGDLVVATQGRSFWILDDLSLLQNMKVEIKDTALYLFQPRPAYRTQFQGFKGKGMPVSAPKGLLCYFFVGQLPDSGEIRMEIRNDAGELIRAYSTQPQIGSEESLFSIRQGMNKWVWDLKLPEPKLLESAIFSLANTDGAYVPTGVYQLTLKGLGNEHSCKVEIKKDPRWEVSDEDLQAQFELTRKVQIEMEKIHAAIRSLRQIRSQIREQVELADKAGYKLGFKEEIQQVQARITGLEEQLIQTKNETDQDPINYPSKIDDQYAYLYSVVKAQDSRPTAGCYLRLSDLNKELEPLMDAYKKILEDVNALDRQMEKAGIPRIIPR